MMKLAGKYTWEKIYSFKTDAYYLNQPLIPKQSGITVQKHLFWSTDF